MKKFKATIKVIYEFEFESSLEKNHELEESASQMWYTFLDFGKEGDKFHDTEIEVDEI